MYDVTRDFLFDEFVHESFDRSWQRKREEKSVLGVGETARARIRNLIPFRLAVGDLGSFENTSPYVHTKTTENADENGSL